MTYIIYALSVWTSHIMDKVTKVLTHDDGMVNSILFKCCYNKMRTINGLIVKYCYVCYIRIKYVEFSVINVKIMI